MADPLPQANAQPVANMKPLGFDSLVVEDHAAVGQHAVDVGKDQPHVLTAVGKFHDGWFRRHSRYENTKPFLGGRCKCLRPNDE